MSSTSPPDPDPFLELKTKGYQVIPNVLDASETAWSVAHVWDWLEGLGTGINRHDRSTWTEEAWPITDRGIVLYPPLYHEQFVWDLRSHSQVVKAFADIHGTDDLLVSFDRVNLSRPLTEAADPEAFTLWLHTDQSNRNETFCVQGFVNLQDSKDSDGGLVVIEGSHRLHSEYFEQFGYDTGGQDWWPLEDDPELEWFLNRGCKLVKVSCPAGSLVLWNSKTFHCNAPPTGDSGHVRMVAYVSMLPRSLATTSVIRRKQKAFKDGVGTTHWASKCTTFEKVPTIPDIETHMTRYNWTEPESVLNEVGYALAGFKFDDESK